MADAVITDAVRDRLFNRMSMIGGVHRALDVLWRYLSPVGTGEVLAFVVNGDETALLLTDLQITRAVIRTDTAANGLTYGRIIDGGAGTNHQIVMYNDQARTVPVSQTTATVNDGGTGTLVAQTGYTMAGTVTIGTIVANVDFAVFVVPPFYSRVDDEYDGTEQEDQTMEQVLKSAANAARSAIETARAPFRTAAGQLLLTMFTRYLVTASSDNTLIEPNLSRNGAGAVLEEPRGRAEDLRRGMDENTGGSGVIKVGPQTATPALTFPGSWTGRGAVPTLTDRAVAVTILGTCTKGLDAKAPEFTLTATPVDPRLLGGAGFNSTLDAEQLLTIGQPWRSQTLGISALTVDYAPTITNVINTPLNTTSTLWTVIGLTSDNSAAGIHYASYRASDTRLGFFTTAAAATANDDTFLVAFVVNPGAASAFTATGDAGVTIAGTTGALVDGDTGTVNWNPPQSVLPFSYFQVAISVAVHPGILQQLVNRGLIGGAKWYLHSATTPNVTDNQVLQGSLFGNRSYGDNDRAGR